MELPRGLLIYDEIAQWPPEKLPRMLAALTTSRGKIPDSRALWIGTRPDSCRTTRFRKPSTVTACWLSAIVPGTGERPAVSAQDLETRQPEPRSLPGSRGLDQAGGGHCPDGSRAAGELPGPSTESGRKSDTVRSLLVDADTWKRIEVDDAGMGDKYALGLDLGQNEAMSAAAAFWPETGRLEAVACFPEVPTLQERGLADGVGSLYVRMAEAGDLIVAGRRVSSIEELLTECLERWGTPGVIVCDRWREAELREKLEKIEFPMTTLEVRGQGFRDGGEDVRIFRKACASGSVQPERSLLLRAAMAEARVVGDPAGNWKLSKATQGGRRAHARDDAAAAAILAVSAGMRRSRSTGSGQKVRAAVV